MELEEDTLNKSLPFDSNDINFESKSRIYSSLVSNETIQNNLDIPDLIKLICEFASKTIKICASNICNKKWEIQFDENGELKRCSDYMVDEDQEKVFCHNCYPNYCMNCPIMVRAEEETEESDDHNRNGRNGRASSKRDKPSNRRNDRCSRSRSRSRSRGRGKNCSMIISNDFNNVSHNPPSRLFNLEPAMVVYPVIGPDFDSETMVKFSNTCPESRRLCYGFNVEFSWCSHFVIGQIGHCKNMYFASNYKKAYCPAIKRYCPNLQAIQRFWFTRCKVKIIGEMMDGTPINFKRRFSANAYYYNVRNDYGWIRITVKLI